MQTTANRFEPMINHNISFLGGVPDVISAIRFGRVSFKSYTRMFGSFFGFATCCFCMNPFRSNQ